MRGFADQWKTLDPDPRLGLKLKNGFVDMDAAGTERWENVFIKSQKLSNAYYTPHPH